MLFNKDGTGAKEAKLLIGFIYLSINFENLITYIHIAERKLKSIIGKQVYTLAHNHYHSSNYNAGEQTDIQFILLDELVRCIQLPIILDAYRRYAPGADLAHSEAGRTITVTDDKKPAFEWMIERDNKNLLDLTFETTETLLDFLWEQLQYLSVSEVNNVIALEIETEEVKTENEIYRIWRNSAACLESKTLLINTSHEFNSIFPIKNSRQMFIALMPFIKEVENRFILPLVKAEMMACIKNELLLPEMSRQNRIVLELSKVPVGLITMSIALKRLSVEVLPDSVVHGYSDKNTFVKIPAAASDRVSLSALLERDGRRELLRLEQYMSSLLQTPILPASPTTPEQFFFIA